MKSTIVNVVAAPSGWVAVYLQHTPQGASLIPMAIALWVQVEAEQPPQTEDVTLSDGHARRRTRQGVKQQEFRAHVAGRDGRVVDYRSLENENTTFLILVPPFEDWQVIGQQAYAHLTADLPPVHGEDPSTEPAAEPSSEETVTPEASSEMVSDNAHCQSN